MMDERSSAVQRPYDCLPGETRQFDLAPALSKQVNSEKNYEAARAHESFIALFLVSAIYFHPLLPNIQHLHPVPFSTQGL